MVPFPVTVPRAGMVRLMFCVRTPSGATRASVLRFWMEVSDPLCDPDNAEIADILEAEIEAGEFGLRQPDRAGDHQFVDRSGDSHVYRERSALQL